MRSSRTAILLTTVASLMLSTANSSLSAESTDAPVMFSTDYGLGIIDGATNGPDRHAADVDDAYAVSLALHGADVQAVVTTFGNDKARPSAESARRGLAALRVTGADELVVAGSEGFLDATPVSFVPDDGSGEVPVYCVNEGVERMRSTLEANAPGSVTLFAIGPFTDVACLQRAFPDAFGAIREIIGLVGSSDGMPVLQGIPVVDFNFAMDPVALGEVIAGDHGVPITFLTFEVTQLGTLTNAVIDDWAGSEEAAQSYYGLATQPHAAYWDAIFTATDGQALFDAHTVYYFLAPGEYVCEDAMLATATVGGYPDTSASTSKNTLTVVSSGEASPTPEVQVDGSTYTYTGAVRGCSAFRALNGASAFEQTVADSVAVVTP